MEHKTYYDKPRVEQVLKACKQYQYPFTIKELEDLVKLSYSTIRYSLNLLIEDGVIKEHDKKGREVRYVVKGQPYKELVNSTEAIKFGWPHTQRYMPIWQLLREHADYRAPQGQKSPTETILENYRILTRIALGIKDPNELINVRRRLQGGIKVYRFIADSLESLVDNNALWDVATIRNVLIDEDPDFPVEEIMKLLGDAKPDGNESG